MKREEQIQKVGQEVIDLLVEKNRSYGDSALEPANVFANGSAIDNLCCRIDDKLMRIKNKGINDQTEDTVQDLIGYLILLKIALHESTGEKDHDISNNISKGRANNKDGWTRTVTYPEGEEQIYY
tara:strand:- start:10587 stop:10961 length:375 start_codon:yes stop_codon:yes gene_type:complete